MVDGHSTNLLEERWEEVDLKAECDRARLKRPRAHACGGIAPAGVGSVCVQRGHTCYRAEIVCVC